MIEIQKHAEPSALTAYRKKPDARYDGQNFTPVKNDLRLSLLREQGYLCAYCMRRIKLEDMKIEHWISQSDEVNGSAEQLNYKNLLGCCDGNEGSRPHSQTCDTKKGNSTLKFSPAEPQHQISNKLSISALDGRIISTDEEFNIQLNKVLNLNFHRLMSNRKQVIASIQTELRRKPGRRTKAEIETLISKLKNKNANGEYSAFCGAAISYLTPKLR